MTAFIVILAGCQDIQLPVSPAPAGATPGTSNLVLSEDRAILAVQEYLLSKAASSRAKTYLTDLYASGAKWTAKGDLLNDGTRVFNVTLTVDNPGPQAKPYWKRAIWTVFSDRKVLPSPQYEANALRIETDLQGLSGG